VGAPSASLSALASLKSVSDERSVQTNLVCSQNAKAGDADAMATLSLHAVHYQTESGQQIHVSGREIRAQVAELARCNGWKLQDLLANQAVAAGRRLQCRVVTHVPSGWSLHDSSGYIMMRFPGAYSVRGSSFGGSSSSDRDSDYVLPRVGGKRARARSSAQDQPNAMDGGRGGEPATPPRRSQRREAPSSYAEAVSPPSGALVGASQPLLERYHRVLYAASMTTNQLQDGWVLHACGNKKCAVAAHFYLGDVPTNSLDTGHHQKRPCSSRVALPKLQ